MITERQRELRKRTIGSSDAPALAGVDPWRSPLAVYMEKVHDVADRPNEGAIAQGNRWERTMLTWAAEKLGVKIRRNVRVRHKDGICAANLDALVVGKPWALEAKFTGLGHEFGGEGTDEIPDRVLVQTHQQMYCRPELEVVYVPVLLAKFGRPTETLFEVGRNEDLIKSVREICHEFYHKHLVPRIPPPDDGPVCLDVLKRIRREPQLMVEVDPDLVDAWVLAGERRRDAEAVEDRAKAALIAALGDAEGGDYGDPKKIFTFMETKRPAYTVGASAYRVPRIVNRVKKGKG